MTEMKAKAYNLVLRLTRPGSFQRMLQTFAGMRNGNILNGIIEADNRFVPECEEDKESAEEVYNAWRWDMSKTFFANVSNFEGAVFEMKQAGCKELPDGRKIYNRTKREILKLIPEFRSSFDFVETAGRGADGDGNIGAKSMAKLFTTLNKRYTEFMNGDRANQSTRSVGQHLGAAHRAAFVAAMSDAQPTMTPATMFTSAEPARRNTRSVAPRVEIREQALVSRPVRERPSRGTSRAAAASSTQDSSSALSGPGLERTRTTERYIPEALRGRPPCGKPWWNKRVGRMMKCDWISAPGETCPKKHPERPVALLSARRTSDDYMPFGSAPFWGPPSEEDQQEERQSTMNDEDSAAAATPVAFRARKSPKPAVVEHGAVAGCFDAFVVLFCSLMVLHFLSGIDFGSFLGFTPAVTATAYLSHVSVAAVPWYFRGANEAVGWIFWSVRILRSDISIWTIRTLVFLLGSVIMSWIVVKTTIFLTQLFVAVFLELASVVATGACAIRNVVVSWSVFVSRWDSVSAVMLKLGLRKSRPKLHLTKSSRSRSQFVSKKSRRMGALATQATMYPELYVHVTTPRCLEYDSYLWEWKEVPSNAFFPG